MPAPVTTERSRPQRPEVVRLLEEAAEQLGLSFRLLDPAGGYLFELSDGKRSMTFLGGCSPLNDAVSARLADDKYYTELLLRRAGFRVPQSVRCFKPGWCSTDYAQEEGLVQAGDWAQQSGYPLVVKPNHLSHGRHVQVVRDEHQLEHAVELVWKYDYLALVQTAHAGFDLRLDFLKDEYLVGYTRTPEPAAAPESVQILNLTLGARAELLPTISESWHAHAVAVGRALGLRYFGIDFKTPHPDALPSEATVIEVNSSPLFVQMALQGHREAALEAQKRVLAATWSPK